MRRVYDPATQDEFPDLLLDLITGCSVLRSNQATAQTTENTMVHIDKIYTRSGDKGQTGLGNGERVSKVHPRIIAGGSIDETNSAIGLAIAQGPAAEISSVLTALQQFLFDLGADLCVPRPEEGPDPLPNRISPEHVDKLERLIDHFSAQVGPLTSFVLPGGNLAAAALHLARSVCRRAEIDVLRLHAITPLNSSLLISLNRLSDLLFVLARATNYNGLTDVLWQPGQGLMNLPQHGS